MAVKAVLIAGAAVPLILSAALASAQTERITLEDAVRRALAAHPELAVARSEVSVAEGEVQVARTPLYNPQASFETGPSSAPQASGRDTAVSLSQTVELGGKRGRRIEAATSRARGVRARLEWTRHLISLGARRAYWLAAVAADRRRSAQEAETLTNDMMAAADERLRMGAGTQLEVNIAAAAHGRAVAERLAAERRLQEARLELAGAIGANPAAEVEPADEFSAASVFPAAAGDEASFVAASMAARRDLTALRTEVEAAQAEVALARALGVPDITPGVTRSREAIDRKNTTTFGFSIPLPLLNRNQGGRATARAALERANVVESSGRIAAEREARVVWRRYESARLSVAAFHREVVGRLSENLSLAWESFRAGKISLIELNVLRRDLVETRLAFLDAQAEVIEARAALERAAAVNTP